MAWCMHSNRGHDETYDSIFSVSLPNAMNPLLVISIFKKRRNRVTTLFSTNQDKLDQIQNIFRLNFLTIFVIAGGDIS